MRQTRYGGNPKSCWALGFRGDTWVGSNSNHGAGDANVKGTVQANDGSVQPGTGQEVDITLEDSSAVVDAVVVGGPGAYNTYRTGAFLPPRLEHHQHSIPPFDSGHRLPPVSYWYACYHIDPGGALPEVPQVLDVPVAAGAVFAAWLFVTHRRRKVDAALD